MIILVLLVSGDTGLLVSTYTGLCVCADTYAGFITVLVMLVLVLLKILELVSFMYW